MTSIDVTNRLYFMDRFRQVITQSQKLTSEVIHIKKIKKYDRFTNDEELQMLWLGASGYWIGSLDVKYSLLSIFKSNIKFSVSLCFHKGPIPYSLHCSVNPKNAKCKTLLNRLQFEFVLYANTIKNRNIVLWEWLEIYFVH